MLFAPVAMLLMFTAKAVISSCSPCVSVATGMAIIVAVAAAATTSFLIVVTYLPPCVPRRLLVGRDRLHHPHALAVLADRAV